MTLIDSLSINIAKIYNLSASFSGLQTEVEGPKKGEVFQYFVLLKKK
jgi:hypothetical protein